MSCNITKGICALTNLIELYVKEGNFFNEELTPLLEDKIVDVTNKKYDLPNENDNVLISIERKGILFTPVQEVSPTQTINNGYIQMPVMIEVSSANPLLTDLLGIEIGHFCMSWARTMLTSYNISLASVNVSEVLANRQSSPNRYTINIQLGTSLRRTQWQVSIPESILRNITIEQTIT